MERVDRTREDRQFESRKAQIKKALEHTYRHPLDFDVSEIPDNMDYKWVRDSIRGFPDPSRIMNQRRLGWVPVPAENHPERMPEFDGGRASHLDGYIHYDGLVLCQRPKEYGEVEREMENNANYVAMQNIPGREGSPLPIDVISNKTAVQKMQDTESFKE